MGINVDGKYQPQSESQSIIFTSDVTATLSIPYEHFCSYGIFTIPIGIHSH